MSHTSGSAGFAHLFLEGQVSFTHSISAAISFSSWPVIALNGTWISTGIVDFSHVSLPSLTQTFGTMILHGNSTFNTNIQVLNELVKSRQFYK